MNFVDAVGREMQVGDKIVFYQPMSKVNSNTGKRSSRLYGNSAMGPKARSLQIGVIKELKPRPTPSDKSRKVAIVEYNGREITLDRFDRIAVVA